MAIALLQVDPSLALQVSLPRHRPHMFLILAAPIHFLSRRLEASSCFHSAALSLLRPNY